MITSLKLNNGQSMPILGLGTWGLTGEKCISSVKEALVLGYRHIDSAELYRNEEDIGKAIENFPRKKLFLVSKVLPLNLSYNGVLKSCEKSLSKFKTDYLDLYLIHWPKIFGSVEEPLKAFKKLQDEGKIKSFGVSNFKINTLKDALSKADKLGLKISVNQIKYNPLHHDDALVDFCRRNKIVVTAYSPLARGDALDNKVILKIAEKHAKTPSQIVLKWIVQKKIVVIPKASSKKHLSENLDVFNFTLDDEDMEEIDNIQE